MMNGLASLSRLGLRDIDYHRGDALLRIGAALQYGLMTPPRTPRTPPYPSRREQL